jgi:3-deoxy-D-manno-octulosonic-acid transferase
MILIYDLAIRLYVFAIRLSASSGNRKAKLWTEGRRGWRDKIKSQLKPGEKRAWFHCSSLGEFEQGRPVMEKLKVRQPELKIVLTFFSPSGYEVRKNYPGADYVFYLPADTRSNALEFISLVDPQHVFFTKYEYWHHYFHTLKKKSIPLYMVSAIFRPGDRFFKWYGGFFRSMLKCVTHFFVQNEQSKILLGKIGLSNSSVAGDTRFDRVMELAKNSREISVAKKFSEGKRVTVAGSTWHEDEELLAGFLKSNVKKARLIIAPHEISEARMDEVKKSFSGFNVVKFSEAVDVNLIPADVLLIDNIGMLSSLYKYGTTAWIGGGFGKGIHNTLEAAVYGIPVLFGPHFSRFNEAVELLMCGGAFTVDSAEALTAEMKLLESEAVRKKAGATAADYVLSRSGATDRILESLSI